MTQKSFKNFNNKLYSKPSKKNYPTNKTDVYYLDDIWNLDILDIKDYGPKNNRNYRYDLVIIGKFSKFGWTVPLKNKDGQIKKVSFENFFYKFQKKQIYLK